MSTPDRHETQAEKHDRNWLELIQELRVAQTGIQVLAGFLLTLPFTQRFTSIGQRHHVVFLVAFSLAIVTIGLMTTPVALHRLLFGRHEKATLVRTGDLVAKAGMTALGLTLVTVTGRIFGVVAGDTAGVVAAVLVLVGYASAWLVLPLVLLQRSAHPEE